MVKVEYAELSQVRRSGVVLRDPESNFRVSGVVLRRLRIYMVLVVWQGFRRLAADRRGL